jgi:hypothetical protein
VMVSVSVVEKSDVVVVYSRLASIWFIIGTFIFTVTVSVSVTENVMSEVTVSVFVVEI